MKIIVAIDPTAYSDKALVEGLIQAKRQQAELVIIMVAETFHDSEAYMGMNGGAEAMIASANKRAEAVRSAVEQEGVTARVVVEAATSPAESIIRCAEEEKADLIITGHREKKGLDRFLIGSVASKVVAHAPCSVLVVR